MGEQCAEDLRAHAVAKGVRISTLTAVHQLPAKAADAADEYNGLPAVALLAPGGCVMLRINLWVGGNLFNGARGTVHSIVYGSEADRATRKLPAYVVAVFPGYGGTPFLPDVPHSVAVAPRRRAHNSIEGAARTQVPLVHASAFTIHKAQGDEFDHITVYLDAKCMPAAGYTALSRVATSHCYLIGGRVTRKHFVPVMHV